MPSVFSQGGVGGGSSSSNASVGTNNITAPTSSTEIGSIDSGGKLQGASASNPIPVTLEADVVAVDAQITGHAGATLDGTAGSPSTGVLTVQGVSGGQTLPVTATSNDVIDTNNSSTAPLLANAAFTGTATSTLGFAGVAVAVDTDQVSADTSTTGLAVQWSEDGTNWADNEVTYISTFDVTAGQTFIFTVKRQYYRIVYTNGNVNQTYFRLQSILKGRAQSGDILDLEDTIVDDFHAQLTRTVLVGKYVAGEAYLNVQTDSGGSLYQTPGQQGAPSIVTWNSSTPLNTTLLISNGTTNGVTFSYVSSGSFSTGQVIIEFSLDNATWFTAPAPFLANLSGTAANPLTFSSYTGTVGFVVPNLGYASIRLRLSTVITTTGAVVISYAANISNLVVANVQGLSTSGNAVAGNMLLIGGSNSVNGGTALQYQNTYQIADGLSSSGMFGMPVSAELWNGASWDRPRTPTIFQGALVVAGVTTVWQPTLGKKTRLMRYKLELAEDATYASAVTPITLAWNWALPTTTGSTIPIQPCSQHRVVVPTTVLATSGVLWDSDWIDWGNGYLAGTASIALQLGINTIQSKGALTPTFGLSASEQWEAGTIGFQTVGALGGAVLRQQTNSGTSGVIAAASYLGGNTIIVVARVTSSATGTSVLSVTDTASNAYTSLGAITNASDSTYGSSLYLFYSIRNKGNATNVITVAGTNSPTLIQAMALEYQGITAVGGTGISSATGSSNAPAGGSYTPAEFGDLIITACASQCAGTVLSAQPTISGYQMRGTIFLSTGALCVADNFGNGTLATGAVNAQVCGTEE